MKYSGQKLSAALADFERELVLAALFEFQGARTKTSVALGINSDRLRHLLLSYAALGFEIPPPPHNGRSALNAERDAKICELRRSGVSVPKLCKMFNLKTTRIFAIFQEGGIEKRALRTKPDLSGLLDEDFDEDARGAFV